MTVTDFFDFCVLHEMENCEITINDREFDEDNIDFYDGEVHLYDN